MLAKSPATENIFETSKKICLSFVSCDEEFFY